MNLRKKIHAHREAEVFTDSLSDILFILLMFFLIVSTLANANTRKVQNPNAKKNTKGKQAVVVSIDENNNYYVGSKRVDSADLYNAIIPYIQKLAPGADSTIIINADRRSDVDHFTAIMRIGDSLRVKTSMGVSKQK